ncbi:MAG: HypC/HybG/HupF family hydrogenase formation chaperone [Desulfobacterales bacterium]|nr:HypC/HybG/HupF family hydrogenase formation chaperone [Desulfobacterales bacterium]
MCLAIPCKLVHIDGEMGIIELEGVKKEINIMLLDDPKIDDYVILHAGFAIGKLDTAAALETLSYFKQIASLM